MQGQIVNVLGSVSHRVFVIIIQLCPQSSHRQYVREWEWQCSNKTLFGKLDCRLDLPVGHNLPVPALDLCYPAWWPLAACVAIVHLKCGWSELRCAIKFKMHIRFQRLSIKKICNVLSIIIYIYYILK